ncbi:hypothetical protein Pla110_45230 [Polystyrenella longa]|uniref:Methyltransferase FkbM domain-containing protein n=1 Tax=Polystyrenella longa TaxID=2528007 RepID=A0A518CU64_9PLAN|nr:FkbM family methyltransferase [Polystyrenella longa]QDU82761.1 hypothetical protein Pla110_45230 [Polystyrenella longa]
MPSLPRKLFDRVLSHPTLVEQPPVLVDIGASGDMHAAWKSLAAHSICIAFDADQREFDETTTASSGYKQLHLIPAAVVAEKQTDAPFYLTESPFCSSLLSPDNEALTVWDFAPLFEVKEKTTVPTITLPEVLNKLELDCIDWFKTDSQGTDLRLFMSLPEEIRNRILLAEFEPGLIDAYEGEDKLHEVLAQLSKEPFWLSHFDIKGPRRIASEILRQQSPTRQRLWSKGQRPSPGWGEMCYLNTYKGQHSLRSYLLGWMLTTLQNQHGFALELMVNAQELYNEPLLDDLNKWTTRRLSTSGLAQVPTWVIGKLLGK